MIESGFCEATSMIAPDVINKKGGIHGCRLLGLNPG